MVMLTSAALAPERHDAVSARPGFLRSQVVVDRAGEIAPPRARPVPCLAE
jgi:hypothetical protein